MPADRNAFRLGLTLIVFFVLFCVVLWFLAPRGGGDLELHVRFPHDRFNTPLKQGAEVVCGGKTVGSVSQLTLREMKNEKTGYDDYFAVITFKVESSLGLREDCRIEPSEALLGGMGILVIKDRGLGEPVMPGQMLDGEPVAGIGDITAMLGKQLDPKNPAGLLALIQAQLDPSDMRSLISKIHQSVDDVNNMTRNIAGESDPRQRAALVAKLHDMLNNVNDATASLRLEMNGKANGTALARIHAVLDHLNLGLVSARGMLDDNREPVRRTVKHVEETTRILEHDIAMKLAQQLDTANAASLLARIHVSIERLGRSLEGINSIADDVRDVVALNKNNLDIMLSNLKETSDHLKAGSKEIRLNPWLLLYTPSKDEVAQANLSAAARAFSEAATRLDDAIARLQAVSISAKAPSPETRQDIETIRAELNATFQKFSEVEQQLWEQLNIK